MFYAHISLDFILPNVELYNRRIVIQDESRKKDKRISVVNPSGHRNGDPG